MTVSCPAIYILDEIDAALDDINSNRVAKLVQRSLANAGSQVISISVTLPHKTIFSKKIFENFH